MVRPPASPRTRRRFGHTPRRSCRARRRSRRARQRFRHTPRPPKTVWCATKTTPHVVDTSLRPMDTRTFLAERGEKKSKKTAFSVAAHSLHHPPVTRRGQWHETSVTLAPVAAISGTLWPCTITYELAQNQSQRTTRHGLDCQRTKCSIGMLGHLSETRIYS
jgi:hypothetical protein